MLPKTASGEKKHRKHVRELEISLTIDTISKLLGSDRAFECKSINVLEFGCGDGYQIPYLQQIGNLVASDIYTSNNIKNMEDVTFVECSINNTPFGDEQFDIVFSNHVIEHIEDIRSAFAELKRIGKSDCIYAFSVPTNIWLLLSIPAQYYVRLRNISKKLLSLILNERMNKTVKVDEINDSYKERGKIFSRKFLRTICPTGHGVYSGYIECYRSFRIKKCQELFTNNGFSIIKTHPLLLAGPSEWPIILTTKLVDKLNVCSSVLFILKKKMQ